MYTNISSIESDHYALYSISSQEIVNFEFCSFQSIKFKSLFQLYGVDAFLRYCTFNELKLTNLIDDDFSFCNITFINSGFNDETYNNPTENIKFFNCSFGKFTTFFENVEEAKCYQSSSMHSYMSNINSTRLTIEYTYEITVKESVFYNLKSLGEGACLILENVFICNMDKCTFDSCSSSFFGGVLYGSLLSQINVTSCCFSNCSAFVGNTLYIANSRSSIYIKSSIFSLIHNSSLISFNNILDFTQSNISSNYQFYGINFLAEGYYLTFDFCIIAKNFAEIFCDQVYLLAFDNTLFTNNQIYNMNFLSCYIHNSYFTNVYNLSMADVKKIIASNSFIDKNSTNNNSSHSLSKILPVGYLDIEFPPLSCFHFEEKSKSYTVVILVSCIAFLIVLALSMGVIIYFLRKRSMKQQKRLDLEKSLISDFG